MPTKTISPTVCAQIFAEANEAGYRAAKATTPTPMVVQQHANPANDGSPVVKQWFVPGGVCGFAWVKIRPANCAFAKWLIVNKGCGKDGYAGGLNFWVRDFGQSMELKEVYAGAFANVLGTYGIKAYSQSRID